MKSNFSWRQGEGWPFPGTGTPGSGAAASPHPSIREGCHSAERMLPVNPWCKGGAVQTVVLSVFFLFFFFNFIYSFIYLWLCWVFVSVRGLSPVAASGGHSSSRCTGLSPSRPLLLWSTGSRRAGSVVVAYGPSCSAACGIFPDQGSNPCPLHWQADSQPLRHQGSPVRVFIDVLLFTPRLRRPLCQKHIFTHELLLEFSRGAERGLRSQPWCISPSSGLQVFERVRSPAGTAPSSGQGTAASCQGETGWPGDTCSFHVFLLDLVWSPQPFRSC